MKHILLPALLLLPFISDAQCDFDPVITPGDTVICPGDAVDLMTQLGGDSYQWFMNGQPIDNATDPMHTVTYFDSGVPYTVAVTMDGCTEMSPPVLVDGWVFLLPSVMHLGDEPIAIGPMGESVYCEGQDVQLQLGMPYTENIVWTNNGAPIPNENGQTLVVTEDGSYSVSGAPSVCPNYIAQLGVTVEITFQEPQQPVIMASGDEICAFPLGDTYSWYFNGEPMPGTNSACIMADVAGSYSVYVDYGQNCQVISEPYMTTSVAEHSNTPWQIHPNPSAGRINISMPETESAGTFYTIFDAVGQQIRSGWMPLNGLLQMDLADLQNGSYLFQAARNGKALAPATRFTIVK